MATAAFTPGSPLAAGDEAARAAFAQFVLYPDLFKIPHAAALLAWAAAQAQPQAQAQARPDGPTLHVPVRRGVPSATPTRPSVPPYVVTLEEALARAGKPACPAAQSELAARLSAAARGAGVRDVSTGDGAGGLGLSHAGVPIIVLGKHWAYLLKRALSATAPAPASPQSPPLVE